MKRIYALFIICFLSYNANAQKLYQLNAISTFTGAANYCLNDVATPLTLTYNTCTSGTGLPTGTGDSISWYYNTTASTVGATLVSGPTYFTSDTQATGIQTYLPPTNTVHPAWYYYCVIKVVTAAGCGTPAGTYLTSAFKAVTVNNVPNAIFGSNQVCLGGTTALGDATGGGSWISSSPGIATVGSSSGIVAGAYAGSVTISYVLSATGCYATTPMSVNNPPAPIHGPNVVCVGSTITLTDSITSGTWSSAVPGTASVGSLTGIVTGVAAGATSIIYSNGCTPVVYSVTVNAIPSPIVGSTNLCNGIATTLMDATGGGFWQSGDTTIARVVDSSGVASGVSLGTTFISYILPATGCYRLLTVNVHPAAPVLGIDTICHGATTIFTNIVGSGTWLSSNPAIIKIDTFLGTATAIDSGISFIVYTTSSGCATSRFVRVLPALPAISGMSHVCFGSTITLSDAVTGGVWTSANVLAGSINDSTGVLSGLTADTVKITYTKPYGCVTSRVITVNPLPEPVITHNYATHSVSTFGYYVGYQWYDTATGLIAGAITPTYVLPYVNKYISVKVTDTNGCSNFSAIYFHNFLGVNAYAQSVISIYPNPSEGMIHISAPVTIRAVISGLDGRNEMEQSDAKEMNVSKLANGIHLITLYNNEGQIVTAQKFTKE